VASSPNDSIAIWMAGLSAMAVAQAWRTTRGVLRDPDGAPGAGPAHMGAVHMGRCIDRAWREEFGSGTERTIASRS
jgi:hypothetical protein